MATYTSNLNLKKPSTGEKYDVIGDLNDAKDKIDNHAGAVDAQLAEIAINIKSFGAKGDGVNDDSDAIQNAIDHAALNGYSVYFPKTPNVYKVTKPITLKDYVNITSNGATIKTLASNFIIFKDTLGIKNVEIKNLVFEGALKEGRGGGANAVPVSSENYYDFPCIFIGNSINQSENVIITNCKFKNRRMGVVVGNAKNININKNRFESLADPIGIGFENEAVDSKSSNVTITDNEFKDYGYNGDPLTHCIYISTESLNTTEDVVIKNNNLQEGSAGYAISLNWGYKNVVIENNTINLNTGGGINVSQEVGRNAVVLSEQVLLKNNKIVGVYGGIRLSGGDTYRVKNVQVLNNYISNIVSTAVLSEKCRNVKIKRNIIENAIQSNDNAVIRSITTDKIEIVENDIKDCVGLTHTTQSQGIGLLTSSIIKIVGNVIDGIAANGIYVGGSSTVPIVDLVVKDNVIRDFGKIVSGRSGVGLDGTITKSVIINNVIMMANGGLALTATAGVTDNIIMDNRSIKSGGNFSINDTVNNNVSNNVVRA